ncbi:ABC transporter permease [Oceanidesulfovibrio indonesiensis]|uniref:ABC transporter permease n=1 Tax=Oceanidesulfovibrio indonesiensis TaxID=54767 RepID=A0A7M3MCH3_9BACT|nr:ABC transporter permease [Oceanidesulfovibrio indonesiensis]TVM16175.1 ABC transporter permease [Oceanidesulfovibrio indonesiensis]
MSLITPVRVTLRVVDMAVRATLAFRLRALFVIAAVGLGIASLTLIVAAVDGAQKRAREVVDTFGPDAAFILGGDIQSRAVGQRVLTLSWRDAEALRQSLPGAYMVVPMRAKWNVILKYRGRSVDLPTVVGATQNYASAWNWPLAEGRDFTDRDVELGAKVGLIGATPAQKLFEDESPLGKTVFIDNLPIQIVGVLSYRGGTTGGGGDPDDRLIIPLTTLTQRFNMDRKYFRALRVKFHEPEYMDAHAANLRSLLRHLHGLEPGQPDDFTILTPDTILKFLSMLTGSLVAFLGVTATVAMLVGGFVLANLFYLSVSERTQEIGLKKAFGAKNRDIMVQFLAESVLLTLAGALLGVALGVGLGQALTRLGVLEIELSSRVLTLSLLAALAIGILFGLRPAKRAAGMNPIEALRGG